MKTVVSVTFLMAAVSGLFLCPPAGVAGEESVFGKELPNAVTFEEGLVGGGTPTEKALRIASQNGYKTVIDVRTPAEGTAAEKALAKKYGLRYVNIPTTADNLSQSQADQLYSVLDKKGAKPAILHCANGNRAAAVWAIYRKVYRGASTEEILTEASQKGVSKNSKGSVHVTFG